MRVRCPECNHSVDAMKGEEIDTLACPSCGREMKLLGEDTVRDDSIEGDFIGHFNLQKKLGTGAFGNVWKAIDKELDRTVALKIPRKDQISPKEAERFLREARAVAQLKHPNIVSVHEVGKIDGQIYIVSDFVEGINLADRLTGPAFSFKESAILCRKVADALHHAHEEGVIHRDLKPSNIMIGVDGEPHLLDFGMARRETGETTVTLDGKILGTPAYMSPEQAAGMSHEADCRSDVYSLGTIFYEMLTGEKTFRGNQRMLLHQVVYEDPKPPKSLNDSVPKDLNTITLKCIEKEPEKRFQSARELSEELTRYLNHKPILARPIGRFQRFRRWCKRNTMIASLSFLLLFVLVGGISATSYWAIDSQQEKNRADAQTQAAVDSLVETLLLAPAESVPEILKRLEPFENKALPTLRRKFEYGDLVPRKKLHAAYALTVFGEKISDFLIESVINSPPDESENLANALKRSDGNILYKMIRRFQLERNEKNKVHWVSTILALGEKSFAQTMLRISSDPINRTIFIAYFHEWPSPISQVLHLIETSQDFVFRSGLYAALGWMEPHSLSDANRKKLLILLQNDYLNAKDALTHSTAGWVLRKWKIPLPKLPSTREAPDGYQWYYNRIAKVTMVRVEAGTLTVHEKNTVRQIQNKKDIYIANMEVSRELFKKFYSQLSQEERQKNAENYTSIKTSPSPDCPAQNMDLPMSFRFCNWLSRESGLVPCYRKSEHGIWNCNFSASGFRLPTESEWEYAGRAGTTTKFHFGNNSKFMYLFTVFGRNSSGKSHPCGSLLPNLFGLFDIQGNVQEWCWNENSANRTEIKTLAATEKSNVEIILRGGNWFHQDPSICSPSTRLELPKMRGYNFIGFRLVRNAD